MSRRELATCFVCVADRGALRPSARAIFFDASRPFGAGFFGLPAATGRAFAARFDFFVDPPRRAVTGRSAPAR